MKRPSVRTLGWVLAPLILVEGVLGIVSAGTTNGRGVGYLAAHLGLGLALAGVSVWILRQARGLQPGAARTATVTTGLALLATAVTGAAFLLTANGQGLLIDRLLALVALAGALAMIVTGGNSPLAAPSERRRSPGSGPSPPNL